MKPKPCLHPKYITCKDGVKRSVPCGHCAACVINKGIYKANRIKDYIQGYPFQFFCTLTFDDQYLPLARYSDADYSLYHDIDCDYNGLVYSYSLSKLACKDKDLLLSTIQKYGGVPVLSRRVFIKFKKRLRYYLSLHGYGKDLFIYGAGEYGPTTYRPHYHFIFGSKSFISDDIFKECLSKAWSFCSKTKQGNIYTSFGFTNVQRAVGKSSIDYIAKYICCNTHLPSYLAFAPWKPFACGSTRCSEHLSRSGQGSLREVFNTPVTSIDVLRNGKYRTEPVPDSYKSRYFPLVSRFAKFTNTELYFVYSLYERYSEGSTAYECFHTDCSTEVDIDFVNEAHVFDGREKCLLPLTDAQRVVCDICFRDAQYNYIEDEFVRKRNFMRLWYISRRVCLNAKELDITVSTYVDKIIEYYNTLQLTKLKRFYEYQNELLEDVINPVPLDYIFTLYYHTPQEVDIDYYCQQFGWHGITIDDSVQQRKYSALSEGILHDTTKTKKRNDKFASLGLVPKPYVPRIPNSINRFKSI